MKVKVTSEKKIGYLFKNLREHERRTVQNTSRGIISQSELTKFEEGQKNIDYLSLEALFETLGKCIDKLEIAISYNEYKALDIRNNLENELMKKNYKKVENLLEKYKAHINCKKKINKQYIMYIRTLGEYFNNLNIKDTEENLKKALDITMSGYKDKHIYYFQQEIRIYQFISYLIYTRGDNLESLRYAKKIEQYIEEYYNDNEAKAKIYPQSIWLVAQNLLDLKCYEEAEYFVQKGIECVRKNGILGWMGDLIKIKIECAKNLKEEKEVVEYQQYFEAFKLLYEITGKNVPEISIAKFLKSNTQREFVISNQFIKNLRTVQGISQEQLCENICAWETISRIERGREPNKKNMYLIWKKLGIKREYYYGFIEAEQFSVYQNVREYNRLIGKSIYKEADWTLYKIKQELDMSSILNKQYIGVVEVIKKYREGKIINQDVIKSLWELLSLTMPELKDKERIYRLPFRTEFIILNQIAERLNEVGKTNSSLKIYETVLKKYKENGTEILYHVVPGKVLYINYAADLEEDNQLIKAEKVSIEGLNFAQECLQGDTAASILGNMSCIYGKQGKNDKEEKCLKNSYYLNKFYENEYIANILKKAYKKKFDEKID